MQHYETNLRLLVNSDNLVAGNLVDAPIIYYISVLIDHCIESGQVPCLPSLGWFA